MKGEQTNRIEDLTGGINQLDYPSEIDNKQVQDLHNFNFEGNKLVSSKGKEQKFSSPTQYQGIKLDSNDVWQVSGSTLYKNSTEQQELQGVNITFNTLDVYWSQYSDNLYFYIDIDGIEYEVNGVTQQNRIDSLKNQLDTNVYRVEDITDGIFVAKLDFTATSATIPNYKSYIVGVNAPGGAGLDRTDFYSTNRVQIGEIGIDGKPYISVLSPNDQIGKTMRTVEYYKYFTLKEKIELDGYKTFRYHFDNDIDLNIGDSSTSQSVGLLINKVGTINYNDLYSESYTSVTCLNTDNSYTVTFDGYSISGTFTAGAGTVGITNLKNDLEPKLPAGYYIEENIGTGLGFTDYFYTNCSEGIFVIYNNSWIDTVGYKSFIRQIDLTLSGVSSSTIYSEQKGYTQDKNLSTIFTTSGGGTAISFDGITDITIGNKMQLLIDREDGGAAAFIDNIYNEIGEESVGKPTVGTIYNGKIVFGGYPDNDNIVFSKTASPNSPLTILEFDGYDAGGQSVSGGDKGRVVGMTTSENGLYVFKDNSIWYTNSEKDSPDANTFNFIFRKITSSGAYTQSTITQVEQDVFYLDWKEKSIRRLSYEHNLTTLRDTAISRDVENILKELPEEQTLATSSYAYPNYRIFLSDHTGPTITYPNGKTYNTNNICLTYNVYNKSWTIEEIGNITVADKGYIGDSDLSIYKLDVGNLNKGGQLVSKEYTEGDDFIKKKYNRFKILGRLIPETGESLSFTISAVNHKGETIKSVTDTATETKRLSLDINSYFLSESVTFNFSYTGKGKVEIYDLFYTFKPTKI